MKIGLQTWGTDGDFMPFLALAIGLKNAGHQVTLAYISIDGKDYSSRSNINGISIIKADHGEVLNKGINPYAIASKPGSFLEYSRLLELYFDPLTDAMYSASEKLCKENDLVIGHAVCHTLLTASQKHKVPRVSLVLTPLVVKSKYASPIGFELGTLLNSFLWSVGDLMATQKWFKRGKSIRQKEGLPAIKSLQKELFTSDVLTIVAASESLCPRPKDWTENILMTGFLNLPPTNNSDWQIPYDLQSFLDSGEPPLYMTFGSCLQFDLQASTQLLIDAAKQLGKRAIIQSDWSQLPKVEDKNIHCIERVPHAEVFPHCSLIVHHGGAGTTQSSLLAGKPSVVVAHGFDQLYWGEQLEKVGVSGNTLTRLRLTPEKLANEINHALNSTDKRSMAEKLGTEMRNENGVQRAVTLIESIGF